MRFCLAVIALAGHAALGTILINRIHATAIPRWLKKSIDILWVLWHFLLPIIWLAWVMQPDALAAYGRGTTWLVYAHLVICACAAASLIPGWVYRRLTRQTSRLQRSTQSTRIDVAAIVGHKPVGTRIAKLASLVPGNEIFQLEVNHKQLELPRLPAKLAGLTITHFSDVHFTGALTPAFHKEIVRQANALDSDLIALTGDLIDKARCFPWLSEILGELHARHGVFFILGNHDLRIRDPQTVRDALTQRGLIDLGGQHQTITIHDTPIQLAGNELPWFSPAADLSSAANDEAGQPAFRILLSHAPDQITWAKRYHVDLMLAGHTHGGQVQLPLLGPLLSPSRFGVRYASGTFYEDPTLMHVSRGISGTRHLRFNASPELTQLKLVPPSTDAADTADVPARTGQQVDQQAVSNRVG